MQQLGASGQDLYCQMGLCFSLSYWCVLEVVVLAAHRQRVLLVERISTHENSQLVVVQLFGAFQLQMESLP